MKRDKILSILVSIAAYIVAVILAIFVFRHLDTYHVLIRLAAADLAATVLIFITSMITNNSSMYDPYWSVKPVVIIIYFAAHSSWSSLSIYQWLLVLFVFMYGLRLTLNFYRGWPGLHHEDWRYVNFRKQFPKQYWTVSFLGIHLFPTIMVFLGCLPFVGAFSQPRPVMPWLTVTGLLILLGSVILAFIADEQLRKFKLTSNRGMIDVGLWRYSRHPNYLGEILTWWGIFFTGLSFGMEYLWTGIGALTITIMFAFVSIPLMEKHLVQRRDWYRTYQEKIPSLLPIRFSKK